MSRSCRSGKCEVIARCRGVSSGRRRLYNPDKVEWTWPTNRSPWTELELIRPNDALSIQPCDTVKCYTGHKHPHSSRRILLLIEPAYILYWSFQMTCDSRWGSNPSRVYPSFNLPHSSLPSHYGAWFSSYHLSIFSRYQTDHSNFSWQLRYL